MTRTPTVLVQDPARVIREQLKRQRADYARRAGYAWMVAAIDARLSK